MQDYIQKFKKYISKIFNSKYFPFLTIVILIAIGIILRINQLKTDFWYDEAFTGIVVKQNWADMFETIRIDRVHPPTFYVILKLWTLLFGSTEIAIRSFIIPLGTSLIPLSYSFFTLFEKDKIKARLTGIAAAVLITFSPFLVAYSAEARSYSFLAMIGLLSLIAFYKALLTQPITKLNKSSLKLWGVWVLLILLIMFTHYLSIIIITGYGLAIILKIFHEKGFFEKKNFWVIFWGTIFALLVIFVVLIKVSGLYDKIATGNSSWILPTNLNTLLRSITSFLFGVGKQIPGIPPYNEFNFPIKAMSIAMIVFVTSIIAATNLWNRLNTNILASNSEKEISKNQNEITKLYTLTAITFTPLIAFTLTTAIGLNTLVERYAIIYGVFFFIWLTYIWTKTFNKGIYLLVGIYLLSLLFLVYPKPVTIYTELRTAITSAIEKDNTKYDMVIMQDPTDYVLMKFYLPELNNLYVRLPDGGDYSSWAVIKRSAEIKSYEDCIGTCIYAINKVWVTDKLRNDPRTKLIETSSDFNIYRITY